MATVKLLERNGQTDIAKDGLDTKLALEMESILEEAGQSREMERPETREWSYQVPFAGVRYYFF